MNRIKSILTRIWNEGDLAPFFSRLPLALALGLFLAFLFQTASRLHDNRAPKAIVYATNNDAGRAVQTSTLTRWYNSNHFAPYGNLYFRFSHTIAAFHPLDEDSSLTKEEREEITHHFALMLVSLLSLAGFCLFLSSLLMKEWPLRLLGANILLHLALKDHTWAQLVFVAHPDHLLMLLTAVSGYFTFKYAQENDDKNFIRAGLFWGLATAVKRFTVLFIPSLVYLFLSHKPRKEGLRKGLHFIGLMLLSYLVIAFPQNFGFVKHIKFLLNETGTARPASLASVQAYIILMFDQSKWLLLAFPFFHALAGLRTEIKGLLRGWIFVAIALAVLFSRSMANSHDHHVMPFVALLLVAVILTLKGLPTVSLPYQRTIAFFAGLVVLWTLGGLPQAYLDWQEKENHCRPEARAVLMKVRELQKSGGLLLREPYFPFDSSRKELSRQRWGLTFAEAEDATLIGAKRAFGVGFLKEAHINPNAFTTEEWSARQQFYRTFLESESLTTPKGKRFTRIHEDSCGFMIWQATIGGP